MNKMMKKALCLLTVATLLLTCLLCGCGGGEPAAEDANNEASADAPTTTLPNGYYVQVVDALGNPYTDGVVVQFMKDGAAAGMQKTDENGYAAKDLADGTYTIEMMFTAADAQYHHNAAEITLTPEKKSATVTLAKKAGTAETTLTVGDKSAKAYPVEIGCTYVSLTKGERNYLLFTPTEAGVYEFALPGSNAVLGYYGAPHFVQNLHAGSEEPKDGKFTVTVRADMIGADGSGTSTLVLGIDAGDNEGATLSIQRLGDPPVDETEGPWTTYSGKHTPAEYTLPAGTNLHQVDITAKDFQVVLGDDGFYHKDSKDGPLMYLQFKETQYVAIDDILKNFHIGAYLYDDNGNFLQKEEYTEMMEKYRDCADKDKYVYPLTEDLAYVLKSYGKHQGWWDTENPGYLFRDQDGNNVPGVNVEIAWLFLCCYTG